MDSRLADQLVEWHNRHPLARHISIFDVHTLGVVALPFMRSGRPAAHIEPGFAPEGAAPVPDGEHPEAAAAGAASAEPFTAKPGLGARLRSLLARRPNSQQGWPLFNERFINRLSPRRVARFALAHGHSSTPGAADWPQRSIEIDEDLMARTASKAAGAWPIELYLMTAGIDAGPARTRVLMAWGSGQQLLVLGQRCLDPRKLGLALLATALLAAGALALTWTLSGKGAAPDEPAATAPVAASAAPGVQAASSAPAAAASMPLASAASAASTAAGLPALPASAAASATVADAAASTPSPLPAPTAATPAVAGAASGVPFAPAMQGIPDIRPRLMPVPSARADSSPTNADKPSAPAEPKGKATDKPKEKAPTQASADSEQARAKANSSSKAAPPKDEGKSSSKPDESVDGRKDNRPQPAEEVPRSKTPGNALGELAPRRGSGSGSPAAAAVPAADRQVALVGPSSPSKAQAEATLTRMRSLLGQTVRDPDQLQAQVFQTKDGWRPAVWPFASREQAQLVNATLIASGLRTRAVDF
ncbi:hypothetical protein [Roseateles sp.]|jgi:hypothetical protein|uniref:hypothetical protein n=1 Tax=Roseateles sp. TaxID=1971397 RepID=UPI0037C7650E